MNHDQSAKVIIVTDGDSTARKVVERVARNVGGRCISMSAGNPTEASGEEIRASIKKARGSPVLVMVDDGGKRGRGPGERALASIAEDPEIEIIGAIAVASHTGQVEGIAVDASVDRTGGTVAGAVDKDGFPAPADKVRGDTVDILNRLRIPVVIGLGDLGKMDRADRVEAGARVTTQAVQEIMSRAGLARETRG